jgi:toxin ParE1/3/4
VTLDFHPEAAAELENSVDWYAERSENAALRFIMAIEAALDKLVKDPERFPVVATAHRVCSVSGFPFQIIYRTHSQRVSIIAVAHAKRRPGYWKTRT